jgi:hypothetical protein
MDHARNMTPSYTPLPTLAGCAQYQLPCPLTFFPLVKKTGVALVLGELLAPKRVNTRKIGSMLYSNGLSVVSHVGAKKTVS